MIDSTLEFNLITFADVEGAEYSGSDIPADRVGNHRIAFARTGTHHAKLQLHRDGQALRVSRITVYDEDGCIVSVHSKADLRVRESEGCNLLTPSVTLLKGDGHFRWSREEGVLALRPGNDTVFAGFPGIDEVDYVHVRKPAYHARAVEQFFLQHQLIFCRTVTGEYSKLFVEAGDDLVVRRLVSYAADGSAAMTSEDIVVPAGSGLDLTSHAVQPAAGDLRWTLGGQDHLLEPEAGVGIAFPSYFRFIDYLRMLRTPALREALVYEDGRGVRGYDAWSELERRQLWEIVYLTETGRRIPRFEAPVYAYALRPNDAIRVFLAHVAQSLWVDVRDKVPWKLSQADAHYLGHLFDGRKLLEYANGTHQFSYHAMGEVVAWDPQVAYEFLVAGEFVRENHRDTIMALADWCRHHFHHIGAFGNTRDGGPFKSQEEQYEYLFGYSTIRFPLVERLLYPLPGRRHITRGCQCTDGFLQAVLRTINVPLHHGATVLPDGEHSRSQFFTIGLSLAHGDDLYNVGELRYGFNTVPIERCFYTDEERADLLDGPALRDGMTREETTGYNYHRRSVELGLEFKSNYVLIKRCADLRFGENGYPRNDNLWSYLHPYYSDEEITAVTAECDEALATIPDGCSGVYASEAPDEPG